MLRTLQLNSCFGARQLGAERFFATLGGADLHVLSTWALAISFACMGLVAYLFARREDRAFPGRSFAVFFGLFWFACVVTLVLEAWSVAAPERAAIWAVGARI